MSSRKPTKARGLAARAARFVEQYPHDLNATQAAIRAGYSVKTAAQTGERLLRDPRVAAAVEKALRARSERAQVKGDRVVQELEHLALVDIGDIIDFTAEAPRLKASNQIPERARRAIASVKVKRYPHKQDESEDVEIIEFKLCDKVSSLTTLMRHHGLLLDRVKIEDLSPEDREAKVIALLQKARERQRTAAGE